MPPRGDWPESWTDPDYDPIQTYALPRPPPASRSGCTTAPPEPAGSPPPSAIFAELGPARIADHVMALGDRVAAGVRALDLEVVTHSTAPTAPA